MSVVVSVAVGGAFGAISRYGLDRVIEQRTESSFPWSTFVINVSGCLLVGFLIAAIVDRRSAPEWLRAGLVVGFCGGYTTFSTFSYETVALMEDGQWPRAALYVALSLCLSLLAVFLGIAAARELLALRLKA